MPNPSRVLPPAGRPPAAARSPGRSTRRAPGPGRAKTAAAWSAAGASRAGGAVRAIGGCMKRGEPGVSGRGAGEGASRGASGDPGRGDPGRGDPWRGGIEAMTESGAGGRDPGPTPTTGREAPAGTGRGSRGFRGSTGGRADTAPRGPWSGSGLRRPLSPSATFPPSSPRTVPDVRRRPQRTPDRTAAARRGTRGRAGPAGGGGTRPAVRQCRPMSARRDRPSQVRRRPPSTGRPRQLPPPPRHPVVPRTVGARARAPARGMPLPARVALLVAIGALAVVVVATVAGALPRVVSAIGATLGGFTGQALATPVPSETLPPIPASPTLAAPAGPYTNQPTVTLSGTVPLDVVGRAGFAVRIFVALPDQEPVAVREIPVGETPAFVVEALPLEPGKNLVSATLVGPGGESEPSPSVTVVLDTSKPKVTVTSPTDGATVNAETATVTGKTQGRSTVVARNEANGTAATAAAGGDGTFTLDVPLSGGRNAITLTATDPAGNVGTAVITVLRGSGVLTVTLGASAYRISAARLPRTIELRAVVTDPDGQPIPGQDVTFTLAIPGVPALTGDEVTDASGTATFRTTVPAGATEGSGLATVFVSTLQFGDASGRASITIIP